MRTSPPIISTDPATELGTAGQVLEGDGTDDAEPLVLESEARDFVVTAEQHGLRLDRALALAVPEFSRSYLQQLIAVGAVTLRGRMVTKTSVAVRAGDSGRVELRPTLQSQAFKPESMALNVVFEDAHLRVIHKPAGLVVHPAPGHWSGTLLNGLLALDPGLTDLPRAGIVHRLDMDTSGLMVVARTRPAMDALVQMMAARSVSRQYLALAHRSWQGAATRRVEAPIGRDQRNRLRMAAFAPGSPLAKPASTTIEWIADAPTGCLVRCVLQTGRTHQIRVHMAMIGHPLVADALYGGAPAAGLQRQALHAYRLAFQHPFTGAALAFSAPAPEDLVQACQLWGLGYNLVQA